MMNHGRWCLLLSLLLVTGPGAQVAAQGRSGGAAEARQAVQEANALLLKGDYKRAEVLYREAIQKDVQLVEAYNRYSMLLFAQARHAEGVKVSTAGLEEVPGHPELLARKGMHLYKLGRHAEAYQDLQRSAPSLGGRFEIQALYAQACMRRQDYRGAISGLRSYLTNRPGRLSSRDPAFRVMLATALLKSGDLTAARTTVVGVLQQKPRHLGASMVMAELMLREGLFSRAVVAYEKLQRKARSAETRLRLGQAYLGIRRFAPAFAIAGEHLVDHAGDPEGLLLKGDAAMGLKLYPVALASYEQARASSSKVQRELIFVRRARVMVKMKRHAEALKLLASHSDNTIEVVTLKLLAAIGTGQHRRAVGLAGKLLELASATNPEAAYHAGLAYFAGGQHPRSRELFARALHLQPRHWGARRGLVRVLCHLARAELNKGDQQKTLALLLEARKVFPRSIIVNRNLGLVLLSLGRHEAALDALEIVLAKVPDDYAANRLTARALVAMNQLPLALTRMDAAVKAVKEYKGLGLAQALAESAALRLRLGKPRLALWNLKQALALCKKTRASLLVVNIHKNITRARVKLAQLELKRGQARKAHRELMRALKSAHILSEDERTVVQTAGVIVALASGYIGTARRLSRKIKARGKLEKALRPPFNKLGSRLLSAYTDYLTPLPRARLRAAAKLQQMSHELPPASRKVLNRLALSALEQTAVLYYKKGQLKGARQVLAQSQRLIKAFSPEQRHNLALVQYAIGQRRTALSALESVKQRIPLAHCNIAVHLDNGGNTHKAYKRFKRCKAGHGRYPGLERLLQLKRRVLEGEGR